MKQFSQYLENYTVKVLLLAALYIITGKFGLLLATPPGYATLIWPPSGVALGMLIIFGWRIWPGILIGSVLLHLYILDINSVDKTMVGLALALGSTALGSTFQALAGYILVRRFIGLPLNLSKIKEIFLLFIICGPLTCIVSASIGTGALFFSHILNDASQVVDNWLTWWAGDMLGVLVFLPIILLIPNTKNQLLWRGHKLGTLSILSVLALLIPMMLTFYLWKIVSDGVYKQNLTQFKAMAEESEKALIHRMDSYVDVLLGGAGFFAGSKEVDRQEWKAYVDAIQVTKNFPGINGVGYIVDVPKEQVKDYIIKARKGGYPEFEVKPEGKYEDFFLITYIEPISTNEPAVGLNIAFEKHRKEGAILSRRTGNTALTKRILLVQDAEKMPGFLLLLPMYKYGTPINNAEERRKNFNGWIYAPFIAKNFMKDLTVSQNKLFHMRVYDGSTESMSSAIYSDDHFHEDESKSLFVVRKTIMIQQQLWTISWHSNKEFENHTKNNSPLLVLIGGIIVSFLLLIIVQIAANMYNRANKLAKKMTVELHNSMKNLEANNAELEKAKNEAENISRMKGEFVSVVSHELRTPLTSIRGSLGLILGSLSKDLPKKVTELVGMAYKNCERLTILINDGTVANLTF